MSLPNDVLPIGQSIDELRKNHQELLLLLHQKKLKINNKE